MSTITADDKFHADAKNYAEACISNIREMLDKLHHAQECDGEEIDGEPCEHLNDEEWHDDDGAQRAIDEDPLSIQVRGDWHNPGERDEVEDTEFEILLTTGGPAARIVGDLQGGQPSRARFEYQDWFKPWNEVFLDSADHTVILEYAQRFYFGEVADNRRKPQREATERQRKEH
jgi:hypothetical protein